MHRIEHIRTGPPRWRAGVVMAVAAALLGGCVTGNKPTPVPHSSAVMPRPAGVQDRTAPPSAAAQPPEDCDALASLRPPATMPRPGAMPAGSTMQRIATRGRLIVGTDQNNYLFGFRDPFTGQIVGFDIDVARQIAAAIFGDGDDSHVQFVALASDERIEAVRSGRVDLVAETMTINCERLRSVSFSTVYYIAVQRILTLKGSSINGPSDLADRRVCAASGSTSIDNIAVRVPTARIMSVKYWTDCLVMLQQGQTDAVTTDDTILAGLAAQDPNTHLVGEGFNAEPYGLAVAQAAPDFLRFVNGVLERMRGDGTWRRIHAAWLGSEQAQADPPPPRYRD